MASRASTGLSRSSGHVLRRQPEERGRVYQQTFIDTYTKVASRKLYDRKMPSRRWIYSTTVCRSVSDFGATARR